MKIYVGGSSEELVQIRLIMKILQLRGHTITFDWTQCFSWKSPDLTENARLDLEAIREADLVLLVFERNRNYQGTHTEMGIALALGKEVIILGPKADKNIFSRLCTIYHELYDVISELERRNENE